MVETPSCPAPPASVAPHRAWLAGCTWERVLLGLLAVLLLCLFLHNFYGVRLPNADDIADSLRPMSAVAARCISLACSQGRIFPLNLLFQYPYFFTISLAHTVWYDVLNLGTYALALLLFGAVLACYVHRTFALLALACYLCCYPLLWDYTSPAAYPVFFFLLISVFLLSLLALHQYYATGRSPFLWLSLALLSIVLFTYESLFLIFFISYLAIAIAHLPRPVKRSPRLWPVIIAVVLALIYVAGFLAWRKVHPPIYDGVVIARHFTPSDTLDVIVQYSYASTIFHYWVNGYSIAIHHPFTEPVYRQVTISFAHILAHLTLWQVCFAAGLTLFVGLLLRRPSRVALSKQQGVSLLLMAMVIILGACGPVAVTPKYIAWVRQGNPAYLCSSFAYFGIVLILATLLCWFATACTQYRYGYQLCCGLLLSLTLVVALASGSFNSQVYATMREHSDKWPAFDRFMHITEFAPLLQRQPLWTPPLYMYNWYAFFREANYWGCSRVSITEWR